ncbi:hypothetical protein [Agromyces subbeticus]|uniref:hypothetical protein n=1 Tax=Agromyces subbeticus TaxID=293890 RepID=UPI0003B51E2E|nr:hypothetical protein [Agromyces subbeticus]
MPKPPPLPRELRDRVADDIRAGMGRNAIARAHGISTGSVTNIARDYELWFERSAHTAEATRAQQIDQWAARIEAEDKLLSQYFALTRTTNRSGEPTRSERRLSYALYNVRRHHNGTFR